MTNQSRSKTKSTLATAFFGLLAALAPASAQTPVAITNAGFEDPTLSDGALSSATFPGWSAFNGGALGVLNPSTTDLTAEAPEGQNVGLITSSSNEDGMSQTLAAQFQADTTYALTVKVANTKLTGGFPGYRVQLAAGGTILAEDDNSQTVAEDSVVTATLNYTYNAGLHAGVVGQALEIRLLSKGLVSGEEIAFDDVQLTLSLPNPVANSGGPYTVLSGTSLVLDGSGSLPSEGATITAYDWDLNNDGTFGDVTGATPAAISYADLAGTWGMGLGANTIKLRVTDSAAKTADATTTVTRQVNANLSDLVPSAGTLTPAFASATTSYTASVPGATTEITVTPTAVNPLATITVDGNTVASGSASGPISLSVGSNPISIVVTGEDIPATTKTYTLTVTRGILYWSANGTSQGGAGTWDTTTPNRWGAAAAGPYTTTWDTDNNGSTAIFGGTAGAISLGTGITASGLTFNTNAYSISAGNTLTLAGASMPIINVTTGTTTINSIIAGSNGLTKAGAGTLTISTKPTYTEATILNGGTLNVSGLGAAPLSSSSGLTFTGNSTLTVAAATLTTPAMTIDPGVTANFNYPGSGDGKPVFTIPSLSGSGTFSADNPGGTGQGKTVAFTDLSAFTGVLQMSLSGASLNFNVSNLNDTVANNIRFAGGGGILNSPNRFRYVGSAGLTLDNRKIEFANGANAFLSIENNGTSNSNLIINSDLAVTATGAKTLILSGTNTGGTSRFAGTITNGSGTISLTKINGTTWNLTNAANTFSGAITFGINTGSYGKTDAANNGTLNYASAGGANPINFNLSTGSGTLNYTGSTDKTMSGAINASALTSGTITLASTGAGAVNYSNTASLGSAGSGVRKLVLSGTNTGDNTLAGQWVNNTGSAATLTKNGTGTWVLTGNSTYTGATTVNAGTLKMGANNVLPNASNVTIGTATLDADTRTGAAGTLDVTGTATINLGVGAALAFADSKAVDWTGGTLNITGTLEATSLRFGDSADDLTGDQLALISVNGSGLGTYVLDANGYLIAGGGLTAYETWAATNAPGSDPDEDFDGDGVPNAIEFVLGGDKDTNDLGKLPTAATDGTNMTFTFKRDQSSIEPGTTVAIEVSTDLLTWDTAPSPYAVPDTATAGPPVAVVDNLDGTDTITLTVAQAPDTKKFARLKVVITP